MNDLTFDRASAEAAVPLDTRTAAEAQPPILHYLNVAKRRKWLLIGCIAIATAIGLIVTLMMTPQYTAAATLEIKRESFQIVQVEGVEPDDNSYDAEFYETQWGLLRSQTLAERVATQLRLYDNARFFELFGKGELAEAVREPGRSGASQRQERIRKAGDILLDNVQIAPKRMSRLAEIRFTSPDAALSTQIANAWTQEFIEISLERRFDATAYARQFLEERLEQLRGRLQESERALVGYAANQRIINVPTATTTGTDQSTTTTERSLVAEDLSTLNRELNEAVAARVTAQSRLRGAGGTTPEALTNQTITQLRTQRAGLAGEYARLTAQFEPGYPQARALSDQIQEIDRAIAREETRVRSTLQASFDAASSREAMLRGRVNTLESDLLNLRGRTIQYNIFQREVDTNRQLYDALLQRYKEIGVAGGVGVNNISIVDQAQLPENPSSPNLPLNLLLSILIGGIVGAAAALALEQVDQTISDPRELESALGLPLLGTIPKSQRSDPVEELADPKTALVEAYLSAQTRLAFTTDQGVPRTLTVTSTRPGEGKTTTAYALARQLTRSRNRVVLVDGDMRSPSLHQQFNVKAQPGLSNYLAGDDALAPMLHDVENGLSFISAGPTPPNAAELLTGDRFAKLLTELSAMFDHVVIDAPPVMGLADTPLIANCSEGTIFVVESHATSATMAGVAVSRLRESSARLLGALLTKFEPQKAQYGYGYGYDYGYGYGKGSSETDQNPA